MRSRSKHGFQEVFTWGKDTVKNGAVKMITMMITSAHTSFFLGSRLGLASTLFRFPSAGT